MNQVDSSTKRRTWKYLSERERYDIELLLKEGYKPKQIAQTLQRDRRTIEREIKKGAVCKRIENPYLSRNPKVPDYLEKIFYSAKQGQKHAERMKLWKGRDLKIKADKSLLKHLEKRIADDKFSPDAALAEIKEKRLGFAVTVCAKTVYNMIDRGDFYRLTNKDLPVKRNKQKRTYKKIGKVAKNNVKGRSIEQRPQYINERKEVGHWEMDLIVGKGTTCLQVLTERVSRKELIFKIPNKKQQTITKTLDRLEKEYKEAFYTIFKSITMDNGTEFVDQQALEASCIKAGKKRTTCYYAHPYSSWERGSNENANRLIRRFIPKGANIDQYSDQQIKEIEQWMNNYPRKLLGYKTANQCYRHVA